ncbi:unnamed protein product, partial [Lepidochelys olivacea]
MARRLRLHFAARRSNTDPLSEISGNGLDSNIHMYFQRPSQNSAPDIIQMKLTPRQAVFPTVMQEIINQQQHSAVSSLQKSNKKSTSLQISLQSRRYSECFQSDTVVASEDTFFSVGNEGNSCSRNMADYTANMLNSSSHLSNATMCNSSLGGIAANNSGSFNSTGSDYESCTSITSDGDSYSNSIISDSSSCTLSTGDDTFCSSIVYSTSYGSRANKCNSYRNNISQETLCRSKNNITFDQDGLEQVKLPMRRKTKIPLRRFSSLVTFPRSPSTTPPTSPTCLGPLPSRGPYQTSHQFIISPTELAKNEDQTTSSKGFLSTAVNGLRLSKTICSPGETRDIRPLYLNSSLQDKNQAASSAEKTTCEKTSDSFSCISVHFTQQRESASRDETVNGCYSPELSEKELNLYSDAKYPNLKLIRSTSACLPSNHSEYQILVNELERPNTQIRTTHHILQRSVSLEGSCQKVSCCLSSLKYKCPKAETSQLHIQFTPGNEGKTSGFPKNASICKRESSSTLWKPHK